MILSSLVGDGSGVSIDVVIVIPSIVSGVVVMGIGVIGFGGAALLPVVFVLSAAGLLGFSARFSGSFSVSESVLFLLSWSHRGGCRGIG